jgi:hypothetical protein
MIEDKIKKSLTKYGGKKGIISFYMICFAPVFMLLMGFLNLYASSKWSSLAKLDFLDLLKMWVRSIDIDISYSGVSLKALERFETALLQFGFALIFGIFAYGAKIQRIMNSKIIDILKKHNEWDDV